jgi:maleate cis-trans isomerase
MTVRTRIGLLVPSTNTTCEPDFYRVAPPHVTVHTGRLWLADDAEEMQAMDRMNAEVEQGARYLKTAAVDVVAYGCTTGSFYKGSGHDADLLKTIQVASGVPAVATAPAVVEALRFLGARKISVATPYPDWNNRQLRPYYEAAGFQVLNIEGEPTAARSGYQGINDQSPESILDFASRVCRPEADVLFCSCTAWRSFEVVQELERRVGRPVLTSNQATAWAAFRHLGISRPDPSFGMLFTRSAEKAIA